MKKIIVSFFLVALIGMNYFSYIGKSYVDTNEYTVIPNEAIRLRILANSNLEQDQLLKREIRDRVNENINKWVADLTSLEEGRRVIKSHLNDIEQIVEATLKEKNSNQSYKVEFNKNVEFPTKVYGNFVYPAGKYEAVLITLGEGEGANWWCVLFPPLCFLDFSNGDAVKATSVDEKQGVNKAMMKETIAKETMPEEKETKKEASEEVVEPVKRQVTVEKSASIKEPEKKVEVKFFVKEWMLSLMN